MKPHLLPYLCFGLLLTARVFAADDDANPSRPPEQLDQLFGPIALYPDALIALILPAATFSSDVVLAARYLEGNGDPAKVDDESWDDSVKSLAHYPDIIEWMDSNLAWTKQAGDAFLTQPADVMGSIQRLRAQARAAGTLKDTPQQQIVTDEDNISIVPAQPDVIYVPVYDPDVVYVSRPGYYSDPFLTFGIGYATGFWLGYDFDWGRRRIWSVDRRDRERYWQDHHDWRRHSFPGRPGYVNDAYRHRQWAPNSNYHRPPRSPGNRPYPQVAHPVPFHDRPADRRPDGQQRRPDRTPGERNQRPSGDRSDGPSRRRPESSSLSGAQSGGVPTAASVPARNVGTPPAQSPQQYRRGREERATVGRERPANAATPQVRSAPPPPQSAARVPAPAASQPPPPPPTASVQSERASPPSSPSVNQSDRMERGDRSPRR